MSATLSGSLATYPPAPREQMVLQHLLQCLEFDGNAAPRARASHSIEHIMEHLPDLPSDYEMLLFGRSSLLQPRGCATNISGGDKDWVSCSVQAIENGTFRQFLGAFLEDQLQSTIGLPDSVHAANSSDSEVDMQLKNSRISKCKEITLEQVRNVSLHVHTVPQEAGL